MERSEPTFVPEWLKSSASLNTASHQFQSSSSHSDEQGVSKGTRNKSLGSVADRTTSSYFRRSSSSIGRYSDKEKSGNRHRDHSDSFLGNILPSRFEKEGLRRSQSSVSAKRGDSSWPRRVVTDSTTVNKPNHNNGGKITFERDFPSLGADERQVDSEIGRVPSPGLSSAIQSLPVAVIGGDGWTSALAEVPVIGGSNGGGGGQPVQSASVSVTAGRNMAETLTQGPTRSQTATQLTVGSQRLEELAVKQSRQLIPVTPSLPKPLALNSCDKAKSKGAQLQPQSSHIVNLRPVSTKLDPSKAVGKLQVLKPSRERNGVSKDNLSPTSPVTAPSTVVSVAVVDRKPVVEKRPSSQAQSRNDFFNLMRKKSMTTTTPDNKPGEVDTVSVDENKVDLGCNGDADVAKESGNGSILHSEEEEARFLRSLGWEEPAEEEEGLTEEEINSFYRDVSKYLNLQAASKIFKGTQQKLLMGPLHSQMGNNSSDSKLES